jgi:hypothetical protein
VTLLGLALAAALSQAPQLGLERGGAVVGFVCADTDGDGTCGDGEPGLPGARVMLETGLTAITDREGRFHFVDVATRAADTYAGGRLLPGRHRARIDTRYFPAGTSVSPEGVTIELPMGGIAQVVFAVRPPARKPPLEEGGESPRAELEPEAIKYLFSGVSQGASAVEVAGKPAVLGDKGVWTAWVTLVPGDNPVTLAVRSADGQVSFFERMLHSVRRPTGYLVIPGPLREGPRVELPAVSLAGASAMVTGPEGAKVNVDGREVVIGKEGRAALLLDEPQGDGYQLVSEAPGLVKVHTRAPAQGALSAMAVALLDLEVGFNLFPGQPMFSFFGRGAGAVRARAFGFDLSAELDLRESDIAALIGAPDALALAAPRRNEVFDRSGDVLRTPLRFGDDSATIDPNPQESKLRFELSRAGIGKLGWGTTRAWIGDAEVGRYHRGLTGAYTDLALGKPEGLIEGKVKGWYAPTDTDPVLGIARAGAHDELEATGGSVYWLSRGGVVAGSELVRVEVRDGQLGFPLSERHLVRGRDYTLDTISGRLMLARPLAMFSSAPLLMTESPGAGGIPRLVVDYEYAVISGTVSQTAGGNGELRVGPVRVSAGGAWEQRGYGLLKARALAPIGPVTVTAEFARSTGSAGGYAFSDDGGLDFDRAPDGAPAGAAEGYAFGARARGAGLFGKGHFDLAWRRRTRGFSDAQHYDADLVQQFTGRVEQPIGPLEIIGIFDDHARALPGEPAYWHGRVAGGGFGIVQPRWGARLEGRHVQVDDAAGTGTRLGLGAGGHFKATEWLTLVAGYRHSIRLEGADTHPGTFDDTFAQLGADAQLTKDVRLGVRGGWGPKLGPQLWGTGEFRSGEDTFYGGHAFDVDGPSAGDHRYVSGVRRSLADGAAVYVEDVLAHDATAVRLGRAMGFSQELPFGFRVAARYERGWKQGFESTQPRVRDVAGGTLAWTSAKARLFARAEFRVDRAGPVDELGPELVQGFAMGGGEVDLPGGFGASGRVQWLHTSRDGALASRLLEGTAAVSWRHRLASVVLRYAMQREILPPQRLATAERGFHLLSLLPTVRLHDRFHVSAGLHASFGAVPGDPELAFAASIRPAVRIWQGIEVAAEVAQRSQAIGGGELTSVRGEAGYRFAENFFLGAGYTFYGFTGLGLNDGTETRRDRLYLRAEASW